MKIYLICPVRNVDAETKEIMDEYVRVKEEQGHTVHYPPRDVEQDDPTGGMRICFAHKEAMRAADRVDIFWDPESTGSHVDFGMAFAMGKEIFLVGHIRKAAPGKSYSNVINKLFLMGTYGQEHYHTTGELVGDWTNT